MRCRKCGQKAVINMRQHRLSLCAAHFQEWLPVQVDRFIKKYKMFNYTDRVLVAVSGGKDSLALWNILAQLGFQADGLYIDLGIDEEIAYSSRSREVTESFALQRGLRLYITDIKESCGESIPQINERTHRGRSKPCSVCGLVKRHILNDFAQKNNYDVVLTGHNLDDEAAILLANTLDWSLEFLARGYPVLPAKPGFSKKAKPFCRIYERESAAYAFVSGIAYVESECPFSLDSKQLKYKRILNQWEDDRPGMKLRFYLHYLNALDAGAFPWKQDSAKTLSQHLCPQCGQPTSTGGLCTFCRLFKQP